MKANPFSVFFGMEPENYISRFSQTDEVVGSFTAENTTDHIFMITGVRGSGKTMTFLYRAPKIMLEPLSIRAVAGSYREIFQIDDEKSMEMARMTKGYPFAYQLLGYLYWKRFVESKEKADIALIIPEYEDRLENYVYEKIWSELSPKEREIMSVLKDDEKVKVAEIREELNLTSPEMSVYRDRLNKKGLIDISRYGYVSLKLPRFGAIMRAWAE